MTDFELKLLARIENLEVEVKRLKSEKKSKLFTPEEIAYFEALPPNATVTKDYVAFKFGCSERAVQRGEAGTHKIPRVSRKPLKFIKREVDAAWREYRRTAKDKAAQERAKAKPVKRKRSIISRAT